MSAAGRNLSRHHDLGLLGFGGISLAFFFFLSSNLLLEGRNFMDAVIGNCLARCSGLMTLALSAVDGGRLLFALSFLGLWIVALVKSVSQARRVRAFTRSLRRMEVSARLGRLIEHSGLKPDRVFLFPSGLSFACTVGLFSPRIFISTRLADSLSDEEVAAVLWHERSHLRRRDPLRGVLLAFFAHLFFFIPWAARLLRSLRGDLELIADDFALAFSHSPAVLASALVKVRRENRFQVRGAAGFSDGDLWNERLSRILDPELMTSIPSRRPSLIRTMASLILALSFALLVFPAQEGFPRTSPWKCNHANHAACCLSGGPTANHHPCHS